MTYVIDFTPQAARQFRKLPRAAQEHVGRSVDTLATDPRPAGCEKIAGQADLYRVRAGSYRIVYQVYDERLVVLVVLVGDRRDIYHHLRRR